MAYQNETGRRIQREVFCEEAIPYYTFVKQGTDATDLKVATARATVLGVTLPSQQMMKVGTNGQDRIVRTGYGIGEIPEVVVNGIAFVKLGSSESGTVAVGTMMMSDASGNAVHYTVPSITVSKDGAPSTAELTSIVGQILSEGSVKAGRLIDAGTGGDIVRIELEDRR